MGPIHRSLLFIIDDEISVLRERYAPGRSGAASLTIALPFPKGIGSLSFFLASPLSNARLLASQPLLFPLALHSPFRLLP